MWNRNKAENNLFDKPVDKLVEKTPERTAPSFSTPSPPIDAKLPNETRPTTPPATPAATPAYSPNATGSFEAARKPSPPAAAPSKGSVLGASLRFKGDLVADEDLVVQGQVEGSILHSRSLTIGADGGMKGDIRARRIVVEGSVVGDLYALECVTVRATGKVKGSIYAPRVAIAEGAEFNGRVDMAKAPAVPVPAATTPAVVAAAAADAAQEAAQEAAEIDDAAVDALLMKNAG